MVVTFIFSLLSDILTGPDIQDAMVEQRYNQIEIVDIKVKLEGSCGFSYFHFYIFSPDKQTVQNLIETDVQDFSQTSLYLKYLSAVNPLTHWTLGDVTVIWNVNVPLFIPTSSLRTGCEIARIGQLVDP